MSHLAHRTDPVTSHDAAAAVDDTKKTQIFAALIEMLTERPRAAFELRREYFALAAEKGWPDDIEPHSVARRLSELHGQGRIRESGRRVPSPRGRTATVWEITPDEPDDGPLAA